VYSIYNKVAPDTDGSAKEPHDAMQAWNGSAARLAANSKRNQSVDRFLRQESDMHGFSLPRAARLMGLRACLHQTETGTHVEHDAACCDQQVQTSDHVGATSIYLIYSGIK